MEGELCTRALVRLRSSEAISGLSFNMHSGYLEGIVRGYKEGLLSHNAYQNLQQCDTLEGELSPSGDDLRLPS